MPNGNITQGSLENTARGSVKQHNFERMAIVDRGEAAIRVIRAVRELNREQHIALTTIAMFTEPDRNAMFVREAEDAVCIGPATFFDQQAQQYKSSYYDRERIEQALRTARADSVWVGWGFLAAEPWFAELCEQLSIVFIGPNARALQLLGDKMSARQLAQQVEVPVVPWSEVPIEPAGKGVRSLEVQVIADSYGTTWAVGVRDCTVQHLYQGILAESTSTMLSPEHERELCEVARRLCQATDYRNAGTVKFLYDLKQHTFWFLEFSPHLTAAHAVTEVTTGLDLVKLQLEVARGGHLESEPPAAKGYAVEVHLEASDPENGFASSAGALELFRLASGPGLRIDSGFNEGDVVPSEFAPSLAKIIAWGRNRQEAYARLNRALTESAVIVRGGMNNKTFLLDLLSSPELAAHEADPLWLDRVTSSRPQKYADVALLQAAIEAYDAEQLVEQAQFFASAARGRPKVRQGISLSTDFRYHGHNYRFSIFRLGLQQYRVVTDGQRIDVLVERMGRFERRVTCSGQRHRVLSVVQGPNYYVEVDGIIHRMIRGDGGIIRAPAPAVVVSVAVAPGDHIDVGDQLVVAEAMKMEMTITAPFAGRVSRLFVTSNVQVDPGAPLLQLEPLSWEESSSGTERVRFTDSQRQGRPQEAGPPREDNMRLQCRQLLEALRCQMLGYDFDLSDTRRLLDEQQAVYHTIAPDDQELLRGEDEVLLIFTDICLLFRREIDPVETEAQDERVHSAEQDLLTYLRFRDNRVERLASAFLHNLRRALAHYDVQSLDPSPRVDESLLAIYKSHQRVNSQLAAIIAILERRLKYVHRLASSVTDELRVLLERLQLAAQERYPAVSELAREMRFRYFDEPLFERARNELYEEVEGHLTYLAQHPDNADRDERIHILVTCPQPLQNLLTQRFPKSSDTARVLMLEVLTRRYYRIRQLENLKSVTVDGQAFTTAAYDYQGARIEVVTTFAEYMSLGTAVANMSRFVAGLPAEHDVVVDFYVWQLSPLPEVKTTEQELQAVLEQANFTRRLRRIVFAISSPGRGLGMASTQHFTYRPGGNGYQEDQFYRGLHPMMGKRLQIWRLTNFTIERLPSTEDVYLFHAIARDNAKDERLFAFTEVRDVTPLRDEAGRVVQIPYLEGMLMETLAAMRLYQSSLPMHKRLFWNRVILYVWPPLSFSTGEFLQIMQKLWPATEGLGLEKIVVRAKIADAQTGELHDRVLHISSPGGHEVVLRMDVPKDTPFSTLSEYRQKVVQLRKRGLVYPYEIIHMLTPRLGSTHAQLPPGDFTEYDLDEAKQLVPVNRPYGRNKAGIVVGIIRNYTTKYPEGMTRVILLGDPSRNLGSVAEPECRRINEAINLAERLQVPLEWFTLSAGAKISMDSGTENMDWVGRTLRRLIEFTQAGGEVNAIVNGINVGAQPYWNAEATMLMHTRGILIMTPNGAMVLTGKQSLDYSGGVSAEDNYGIGGYERVMGPNGQAQYFAADLGAACQLLMQHYDHTYIMPGERLPRRAQTSDPATRDVCNFPYVSTRPEDGDLTCIGDLFSDEKNAGRKRAFDIRTVMAALIDVDHQPLERWRDMRNADTIASWDAHIGGYPVAMLGIESRPIPRRGFIPADGPEQWTAGTLFPMSSKKAARTINSASGNRPLVVIANLSGFDGSPESLRNLQLEYGAEIGRAITNFKGPIVFCVVSRYHGGAFVVFSKVLNENLEAAAVEGSYASVIGGVPAAAVVFAREVDTRTHADSRVKALQEQLAQAEGREKATLQVKLNEVTAMVHSEKVGEVASEFDHIHSVQRAQRVGSIDHIIPPAALRPYLIEALERGIERYLLDGK